MSLTGPVFLGLILVITLGAFVALVVLWPRLAGRNPVALAGRTGLLLLVNGLVLLTAATQLNAQYLFFADWRDLSGAVGGSPTATAVNRGSQAGQAARASLAGGATAAVSLPPVPGTASSAARVITYTVHGAVSGLTGLIVVRLPPGYQAPGNATVRYPVLETFSGYPGSPGQWLTSMDLGGVLTAGVAARKVRPAVVVSPQIEVPPGTDTECVNGTPGHAQLETWLAQDVPTWVTHTLRVNTARSSWASIGFSAGGWCAAMVAMLHPAQYAGAVVMGGYFHPDFGPLYAPFGPHSTLGRRYDLVDLAHHRPPPIAMWLETSHSDALSYGSSAALIRATGPPMAVNATVLQHAGHRLSIWKGELPAVIGWLGANLPGFSPHP